MLLSNLLSLNKPIKISVRSIAGEDKEHFPLFSQESKTYKNHEQIIFILKIVIDDI